VTVSVAGRPEFINKCNCSYCTKLGATWAYYAPEDVAVADGGLESFVRADLDQPFIRMFRCATCGCATHWTLLAKHPTPKIGVNAQLFEPSDIEAVETRHPDGRNWER
jgi:hypothetical protein